MNEYVTICITRTSHPWNLQPMCVGEFIMFIERQCSSITLCHKNSKSGGHGKPIKPRRCEAFLFQEIVPNADRLPTMCQPRTSPVVKLAPPTLRPPPSPFSYQDKIDKSKKGTMTTVVTMSKALELGFTVVYS